MIYQKIFNFFSKSRQTNKRYTEREMLLYLRFELPSPTVREGIKFLEHENWANTVYKVIHTAVLITLLIISACFSSIVIRVCVSRWKQVLTGRANQISEDVILVIFSLKIWSESLKNFQKNIHSGSCFIKPFTSQCHKMVRHTLKILQHL